MSSDDALSASPDDAVSASTSSFLSSLFINSAVAGGEFLAFVILRQWIKAFYEPRTYVPPREQQAPVLSKNILWSLWEIIMADPKQIIEKNGVDPYVFIRFLVLMSKAMIPIWLLSWVVLLPGDAANSVVNGKEGLDKFTFGNVATDKQTRYWAHLVLNWMFILWIFYLIWGEMKNWLTIRQKHLVSPSHSKLAQANTVLVTGIPKHFLEEAKLEQLFSHLPGGVKRIWLNRNLKEMPGLYERRALATKKLEAAQVSLIKHAQKYKKKRDQKIAKLEKKDKPIPSHLQGVANPHLLEQKNKHHHRHSWRNSRHSEKLPSGDASQGATGVDGEDALKAEAGGDPGHAGVDVDELSLADQLVPRKERRTYHVRPKWSPIDLGWLRIGHKVDTIDWAREEIARCTEALERSRAQLKKDIATPGPDHDVYQPLNSAFIHFNQQIAAHIAAQILAHNQPYMMNARYIEQSPENVIWRNLSLNQYSKNIRQIISWSITAVIMIFWTTPVAFIGALSNVTTLTQQFPWLSWIEGDGIGKQILQGVISGVIPPALLQILMLLLPFALRQLAAFEGKPSKTEVELDLMTRYFIFLVVHTFFVVTLSSGLTAAVQQFANNPGSIATTLAAQMPTASTFFITLLLTQFTGTMGSLLRVFDLVFYYVKVILLGGSPRSVFITRYELPESEWGETFPGFTVYAVIILGYSIISPIINGFGAAFFVFAFVVYKYLYIWVYDQPSATDTGGLFFPKAITHLFVGLYVQELCMTTLFFLARDSHGNASALPEGGLMVVLILATIAFQYTIILQYGPLKNSLPLSLAHLSFGMPEEKNHEGSVIGEDYSEHSESEEGDESMAQEVDLTSSSSRDKADDLNRKSSEQGSVKGKAVSLNEKARRSGESQRERQIGEGERPPEYPQETAKVEYPPEKSKAYVPHDHDVELGISTSSIDPTSPTSSTILAPHTLDYTLSSPTAPGPPVSRVQSHAQSVASFEEDLFAVPGGPGVVREEEDDEDDEDAFFHPATKEPQRIIWLPRDDLGLCAAELEANERAGVKTSMKRAWLNAKGSVQISGPPPDDL